MASTRAAQFLERLARPEGAQVSREGEAIRLSIDRSPLQITVTVPVSALEWFVEAIDRSSGASVNDWCDYEGYDDSLNEQLDRDMAADVEKFVGQLLSRELRLQSRATGGIAVEWRVGDAWHQAIPLREFRHPER